MYDETATVDELEQQAQELLTRIKTLNNKPDKRAQLCNKLFYTQTISEDLKHVLIRKVYNIKPANQWAYENSSDERLLSKMAVYAPLQLSLVPFVVRNKNLSWKTLHNLLYLHSKTKERAKVRTKMLALLPDSYYSLYTVQFLSLSQHEANSNQMNCETIVQRVKKANGMEGTPDEWVFAMFSVQLVG
jgi:hypothetical protein